MGVKTILVCDTCGTETVFTGPYHIVKDTFKAAGWRNIKNGDTWKIQCPKCTRLAAT